MGTPLPRRVNDDRIGYPTGTVHLAETLRHETRGGVVLAQGLWPFDRKWVAWPRRPEARPREDFLTARFARFLRVA